MNQNSKPARMVRSVAHLALVVLISSASVANAKPFSFRDLLARPRPAPTKIIRYGAAPQQYAQLWLPASKTRHPVVVMIHGGCWLDSLPGTELMAYISEDLRRRGMAVWSIEYRRIGGAGGGYPGTFLDVAHAVDKLREVAPAAHLDLNHLVAVGHSAGGHLALWAAGRKHLPQHDPLHTPNPLPIRGVVSLAGIDDLVAYRATGPDACGGPDTIDQLVGAKARRGQKVYADTSPAAMLPLGVRQVIVSGALDHIVPARFGDAYAARAKAAGDPAQSIVIAGAGHFELIDPTSDAWKRIEPQIEAMLK